MHVRSSAPSMLRTDLVCGNNCQGVDVHVRSFASSMLRTGRF